MGNKVKITKRLVDATPSPERGQVFLRDLELSGFGLRLTPGSRTFVLEKRIRGRMRRMTIGPYGPLTVDDGRTKAKELIGRIAQGEDPAQDKLDQKREATFQDLMEMYSREHLPRKKSGQNDLYLLNKYLAGWKSRKLSSITRKDVVLLHSRVGEKTPAVIETGSKKKTRTVIRGGHYAANRLVALARKMFNLAQTWGFLEGENPAEGIELFKEEKRDRFVKPEELPKLMEALKKEPNNYIQAAFLICLLTGARKNEVLSMKWEHLDLEQAVWRIPETKAGRTHLLPLPRPTLSIFSSLARFDQNPHVFPGRRQGTHLINVDKAWRKIRKEAGLEDVRVHDLRRTLGSWLAGAGASLTLIGKALNHSQVSTTQIYARLDLGPVRAALEANAEKMLLVARMSEKEAEE